jgi:hypothetical protein
MLCCWLASRLDELTVSLSLAQVRVAIDGLVCLVTTGIRDRDRQAAGRPFGRPACSSADCGWTPEAPAQRKPGAD